MNGSGEFAKFVSVEVDQKVLDASNYEASEGSVVIKLKGNYMKTLSTGTHTIKVNLIDGSAETKLTVRSAARSSANQSTTTSRKTATSARTGDESNILIYVILMAAAAVAIGSVTIAARKKKQ